MMNKKFSGLVAAVMLSTGAAIADGTNNIKATNISSRYDGTNNVTKVTYEGLTPGDSYALQRVSKLARAPSSDPNVEEKWVQIDRLTATGSKAIFTDRNSLDSGYYRLKKQ